MPGVLGLVCATVAAMLVLALPAGDALASHVGCGDVITQDTRLDSDLIGCPGNGLVIGSDNVTLDLSGHQVAGDGPDPLGADGVTGIFNGGDHICCFPAYSGVTIRNGRIRAFTYGVSNRGDRSSIQNLVVADSFSAIVSRGDENHFAGNSSLGSVGAGMFLGGTGNAVRGNLASSSADSGMRLGLSDSLIERNVSIGSDYGMLIGGRGSTLRANLVYRNSEGMQIVNSTGTRVERNAIIDNDMGIHVAESEGVVMGGNLVARNGQGVVLSHVAHDNVVRRNRVVDNSGVGIRLGPPNLGSPSHDNQVVQNLLLRNGADGIFAPRRSEARGGDNLILGNVARSNGDDGIDVDDEANVLTRNHAILNRDLGIEAVLGTTDGGGNRAHHNGNPTQCLNVFCRTNGKPKK